MRKIFFGTIIILGVIFDVKVFAYTSQTEQQFCTIITASLNATFSQASSNGYDAICRCQLLHLSNRGVSEERLKNSLEEVRQLDGKSKTKNDPELNAFIGESMRICIEGALDENIPQAGVKTDVSKNMPLNCTLQMTSEHVAEMYAMHDHASDDQTCLDKCKQYAQKNVEIMADSVNRLRWKCNYQKKMIFEKIIK